MSKIQVKLIRDSVCMADDVEDHTKTVQIVSPRCTADAIIEIAKGYLPNIAGCEHAWECVLNGVKAAIIKGNCTSIAAIAEVSFLPEANSLSFKYRSATY
ncbi:MAG: hypothetical protein FWE32_00295 [Oscillospiraceae bacterium]|nr:hypothetical protein [Oscillospiraceae bacterium]